MLRARTKTAAPPQFVWSPAGPDRPLLAALQNLKAGLYSAAAELLEPMRRDSDLRCHRLLILAPAAADSGIADHWVREQPDSGDAQALAARAAVIRAVRAHHARDRRTAALVKDAKRTCYSMAERFGTDPVPHVALLQLAAIEPSSSQDPEEAVAELGRLLDMVRFRAPLSREGHHRLIIAVARQLGKGRQRFVNTAAFDGAVHAPAGSPLHLLPLVAHLENFRTNSSSSYREQVLFADQEWSTAPAKREIEAAYTNWFDHPDRENDPLLPDLHLLAHALYKARMYRQAITVFDAIGPWAWSDPWRLHSTENHDAERTLTWARNNCLEYAAHLELPRAAVPYPAALGLHVTN